MWGGGYFESGRELSVTKEFMMVLGYRAGSIGSLGGESDGSGGGGFLR